MLMLSSARCLRVRTCFLNGAHHRNGAYARITQLRTNYVQSMSMILSALHGAHICSTFLYAPADYARTPVMYVEFPIACGLS